MSYELHQRAEQLVGGGDYLCGSLIGCLVTDEVGGFFVEVDAVQALGQGVEIGDDGVLPIGGAMSAVGGQ